MIKEMITGVILLLAVSAQAQQEFTIQGKIKGLEDGTIISLSRSDGQVPSCIAQDTIRNESFSFEEKTAEDESEALRISSDDKGFPSTWLDIWVAPNTTTTISGSGKLLRSWYVTSNIKEQTELNRYADTCREQTDQNQLLMIKLTDLFKRRRSENISDQDKAEIKRQFDIIRKGTDSIKSIIAGKEIEIMKQTPFSRVWMTKLYGVGLEFKLNKEFLRKEDVIALYNKLPEKEKTSPLGKEITVFLYPPVVAKEGDTIADADLYDLEGKLHHLAEYKGKYMLLDFWSRACGPCLAALPEMKEISESNKGSLTIISLSLDTEKGWKEISKTKELSWVNLNDFGGTGGIAAKYGVKGVPYYVIISPEGVILHKWSGYSPGSLKQKLDKWMNSNLP